MAKVAFQTLMEFLFPTNVKFVFIIVLNTQVTII